MERATIGGYVMEKEGWAIIGVILVAVALLVFALKKQSEWLLNLILRGVMSTIGFYAINQIFLWQNISCEVGINPYTVCTGAVFGAPGVVLLYGIRLCSIL